MTHTMLVYSIFVSANYQTPSCFNIYRDQENDSLQCSGQSMGHKHIEYYSQSFSSPVEAVCLLFSLCTPCRYGDAVRGNVVHMVSQ